MLCRLLLGACLCVALTHAASPSEEKLMDNLAANILNRLDEVKDEGLSDVSKFLAPEKKTGKPGAELGIISDDVTDKLGATGPVDVDYLKEELAYEQDKLARTEIEYKAALEAERKANATYEKAARHAEDETKAARAAFEFVTRDLRYREGNATAAVAAKDEVYLRAKRKAASEQLVVTKASRMMTEVHQKAEGALHGDGTGEMNSKFTRQLEIARRVYNAAKAKHAIALVSEHAAMQALEDAHNFLGSIQKESQAGLDVALRTLKAKIQAAQRRLGPLKEALEMAQDQVRRLELRLETIRSNISSMQKRLDNEQTKEKKSLLMPDFGATGPGSLQRIFALGTERGKAEERKRAAAHEGRLKARKKLSYYAEKIVHEEDAKAVKDDQALVTAVKELGKRRAEEESIFKGLQDTIKSAAKSADDVSKMVKQVKLTKKSVVTTEASLEKYAQKIQNEETLARTGVDTFSKSEKARLQIISDKIDQAEKDMEKLSSKAAQKMLAAQEAQAEVIKASREVTRDISSANTKNSAANLENQQKLLFNEKQARDEAASLEAASKKASLLVNSLNARLMSETEASQGKIRDMKAKMMADVQRRMAALKGMNADVAEKKKKLTRIAKELSAEMEQLGKSKKKALVMRKTLETAALKANEASKTVDQMRRIAENSEGRLEVLKAFDAGPLPPAWEKKVNRLIDGYENGVEQIIQGHRDTISSIVNCHNQAADVIVSDANDKRKTWDPECNKFLDGSKFF